jgi:hypothetical protein
VERGEGRRNLKRSARPRGRAAPPSRSDFENRRVAAAAAGGPRRHRRRCCRRFAQITHFERAAPTPQFPQAVCLSLLSLFTLDTDCTVCFCSRRRRSSREQTRAAGARAARRAKTCKEAGAARVCKLDAERRREPVAAFRRVQNRSRRGAWGQARAFQGGCNRAARATVHGARKKSRPNNSRRARRPRVLHALRRRNGVAAPIRVRRIC